MYEKKFEGKYLFIFGFLAGIICGYFVFSPREGISDNWNTTNKVAGGIESATGNNNEAETERGKAKEGISSAEKRLEVVERSVDETTSLLEQHKESINRCQRILDEIKQGDKS